MKLLLINPSNYDEDGNLMKFKYGAFPPLNLLILAYLVKDYKNIEVTIVDEFIQDIPFDDSFDLVGISTIFTNTFPRVIEICKNFQEKGVPVVLGGTHASCNSDIALKYADSVLIGEAEEIFSELIDDFLTNKKLKKIYKKVDFKSGESIKPTFPDYNLIDLDKYIKMGVLKKSPYFAIETSRGCPMQCTFCSVRHFHGKVLRYKSIEDVIKEIRYLKSSYNTSFFSITDDNFLFNYDRSRELLTALAKEDINFHCEVSTQILNHTDLLPLLKRAGCVSALIGFESLNTENLKFVKKFHNDVTKYKEIFEVFSKNKIPLFPSFMFGFDYDTEESFEEVMDFLRKVIVQRAVFGLLTPFPGTELYDFISQEGRILTQDLSLYDGGHMVFQPKCMSKEKLTEKYWDLYKEFYSYKEIFRRLKKASKRDFLFSLLLNIKFHNIVKHNRVPFASGRKRIRKIVN